MQKSIQEIAETASFANNPVVALAALRSSGHIFNREQQQRLVDTIAGSWNPRFAIIVLEEVPQLTDGQRAQLRKRISNSQNV